MNRKEQTHEAFLNGFGRALFYSGLGLTEFHLLFSAYKEMLLDYGETFQIIEQWFGLVLLCAAFLWLLLSFAFGGEARLRLQDLKHRLRSYEQLFLIFLFFWFALTCAVRWRFMLEYYFHPHDNPFSRNDLSLFITGLMGFLTFPLARFLGVDRAKGVIDRMLKLLIIPYTILCVFVLWNLLQYNQITFPSGNQVRLPYKSAFSLSFGVNRNATGSNEATMLALCLYMTVTQPRRKKPFYIFGMLVHGTLMILTNSRAAWYSSVVVLAHAAFFGTYQLLRQKPSLIRTLSGLAAAAGCMLLLHIFRNGVFDLVVSIRESILAAIDAAKVAATSKTQAESAAQVLSVSRGVPQTPTPAYTRLLSDESRQLADGMSGRFDIYKACLYTMFHSKYCFFFGVTPAEVGVSIGGLYDIQKEYSHAHNIILQMGMSFGVPTMLAFILFLVRLVYHGVRVVRRIVSRFPCAWIVPLVALGPLVADMAECYLCASPWGAACSVFFLFAGWTLALDKELPGR